ncbi:hypothetical protein ACQQ4G_003138 [Listeria monocytogenes]
MIIPVEKLKKFIKTNEEDEVLELKLQALELLIRKYTNNNFQNRNIRFVSSSGSGTLLFSTSLLKAGDTIEISQSSYNNGLYVIKSVNENSIELDKPLYEEKEMLITKVEYPLDVQMGVINMLKWDLDNRDKVGIQSEQVSRHQVTYFNMDGDNSTIGYPKSLIGYLKPYMKART